MGLTGSMDRLKFLINKRIIIVQTKTESIMNVVTKISTLVNLYFLKSN